MNPHRQHHTPDRPPMPRLLATALDTLTALACAVGIAYALTYWSL